MKYYTVAARDVGTTKWYVAFGDYNKKVVTEEGTLLLSDYNVAEVKTLTTDDTDAAIIAAIEALNKGETK
jgi:hypothetical protein